MESYNCYNRSTLIHGRYDHATLQSHKIYQGRGNHKCLWTSKPTSQREILEANKFYQITTEHAQLGAGRQLQYHLDAGRETRGS